MRRGVSLWFILGLGAGQAMASPTEIARPQAAIDPTPAQTAAALETLRELSRSTGASWHLHGTNGATGSIHLAYGSGVPGLRPILDEESALAAARAFIAAHVAAFEVDPSRLETWRVTEAGESWSINFRQVHEGLPVLGGRVNVTMTREGRIYVFGADTYAAIDVDATPTLTANDAALRARAALAVPSTPGERDPKLLVLPVHTEGRVEHHLVWQLEDRTDEPIGRWLSYVDAHTGDVLWRQNAVHFLDVTGTVTALVEDPDLCSAPVTMPLSSVLVSIQGGGGSAITDENGNFSIPAGTTPVTLELELLGPAIDVNRDDFLGTPDAHLDVAATPGTPVSIVWDEASSRWDERDTFLHGVRVHDWMKTLDPSFTDIDYSMPTRIGINDACNAFWDGVGMNFFEESAACVNTGRIGDVVYHEFGHGVTQFIYDDFGDGPPGDLHEGNSDVLANFVGGASLIGNGFNHTCEEGIRDSDNDLCYPEDLAGEGHFDGQLIAGFHWLTRENLMAALGTEAGAARAAEVWHFGRSMGLPFTQEDQVFWTFVADDDNGNLDDGTPNHAALCAAAEAHCFVCPDFGVEFRHDPPGPLAHAGAPIALESTIYSTLASLDPSTIVVRYAVNGGAFQEAPLSGSEVDSLYAGSIPGQSPCAEVDYYLFGRDLAGNEGTDPPNAPAVTHRVTVDPTFGDDFEGDEGWTIGTIGDGATEGIWERVEPIGSFLGSRPVAVDVDHSVPGTFCFVTEQNVAGESVQQNEVDGGTTTLVSPLWNLSGATRADLHYFRWYTDDANISPQEEFWVVQVRNGAGPWIDLENTTSSSNEWLGQTFDLAALFGGTLGTVQVRFRASDLPPNLNIVEAGVDDVWVAADVGCGIVAVGPTDGTVPHATFLAPVRPNPARGPTLVRYGLAGAGRAELGIYDVAGRLVRRIVEAQQSAGTYAILWDRTSSGGSPAAPGTYFVRLEAGGETHLEKLVILP